MTSAERPEILLLSLAFQGFFDNMYSSLIDSLSTSARLKRAKSSQGAVRYLEANNPKAIIVSDEGLTKKKNKAVLEKVQSYLRNGGLVMIGLHFTCFTRMDAFDKLFTESFGLAWKHGDYHRSTFQLNPSCNLPVGIAKDKFPSPYSMKVVHIRNAQNHEKIFVPIPEATTESLVFPALHVDQAQAAVVGAKVGNGFLVYVGDVNAEEGSDKTILALCDLGL